MAARELLETEPTEFTTDSKWIAGISSRQNVCEVASRVLDARLKAVCHALPWAAQRSEEDVEHVHRLRISVRRAVEAVRVFAALIPEVGPLQDRLRRIRRAADEARNWDVMTGRFSHGEGIRVTILEQIRTRRRESQGPIVAVHQELETDACRAKIEQLIRDVEARREGQGRRRFGRQAPRYLAPVVAKFFQAAESDLATDEALHALRIRTKKVRYTMEIVAVAFDSAFRKKLYPQVTRLQDVLGTVNDHATALMLFGQWQSKSAVLAERAFLGLPKRLAHPRRIAVPEPDFFRADVVFRFPAGRNAAAHAVDFDADHPGQPGAAAAAAARSPPPSAQPGRARDAARAGRVSDRDFRLRSRVSSGAQASGHPRSPVSARVRPSAAHNSGG